jgi:hypothetical protein
MEINECNRNDTKNIYRFKLTKTFMEELSYFSKIHQYDDRLDFKEAWNVWIEDNKEMVQEEISRLYNLGYNGDPIDKMFKSARYYFRNKSTIKNEPKQRRQYISVSNELLYAMDEHINKYIIDEKYQPKTAFIAFCKENEDILKETILKFFDQNIKDTELIENKIKKTYKNRFYIIQNNK